jgi:hypothetical protein
MAWIRGGRYYQISRRVNGKVCLQYYGRDSAFLQLCLAFEAEQRAEEATKRREERERLAVLESERRAAKRLARRIDDQAELLLGLLGFCRHARGRWRKRMVQAIECGPVLTVAQARREVAKLAREFKKLTRRRDDDQDGDDNGQDDDNTGDREVRRNEIWRRLQAIGQIHPELVIRECWGDLARLVWSTFEVNIFDKSDDVALAVELRMKQLVGELCGTDPVPALKLAAEAAALAWLHYWLAELKFASATNTSMKPPPLPIERQLSFASRRYQRALASVEQIRRLSRRGRLIALEV